MEQHWGTEVSNAVYAALQHQADNIAFVGKLGGTTGESHTRPFQRDGCVFLYTTIMKECLKNE
ncbi:hypothetical protein CPT06_05455 [Bacillus vallismortis]|nr:hypothetical protein CPT06_05455 [Bacillus vallismortis]